MCATRTQDIDATVEQAEQLRNAGAAIVRIAIDSDKDAEALKEVRRQTNATTFRLIFKKITDSHQKSQHHVDKIRYNPGHLHHHEKEKSIPQKVEWLASCCA